jgi:hypothetical protein
MKKKNRHSNKDLKQSKAVDLHLEAGTGKRRSRKELFEAEEFLNTQVWYNRHQNLRITIEEGECTIVDEEQEYPHPPGAKRTIQRDIWEQAKKAARKAEKRYGIENLGPWTDFRWGMVNGKLSAIRWALGEEWDWLDT